MDKKSSNRLGVVNKDDIKSHKFFTGVNFKLIETMEYHAPEIELEENDNLSFEGDS